MPPRSLRAELPQHYGLSPGQCMIGQFGSTQRRTVVAAAPTAAAYGALPDFMQPLKTRPTSMIGQFPRAARFSRRPEDEHPGPGEYSPANITHRSAPFLPISHARTPVRTGRAPSFNSTSKRAFVLTKASEAGPGPIYTPTDACISTIRSTESERALAAYRAGGRARWSDTAPSVPFASKMPRCGGWQTVAGTSAPGPGTYSQSTDWPLLAGPTMRVRPSSAFSSTEPRFRPTSDGGARLLQARAVDQRAWPGPASYTPLRTYLAANYTGLERPSSSRAVTASFGGPPRFAATRQPAPADLPREYASAAVDALIDAPMPAGSRAARWPTNNRHFERFEHRWRATALAGGDVRNKLR